MRRFGRFLLAMVSAAALVAVPTASAAAPEPGTYQAVVDRTEFGIPHVRAADFGGLGYGYGYAFAQDDVCSLEDTMLTVSGQRSEFLGPAADAGDVLAGPVSNLDSDVYYRATESEQQIDRLVARPAPQGPSPQAKQLVDGYVAGVNRYLRDVGAANIADPACHAKPWVRPITALDVYRIMYGFDQFGGTASVKPLIAEAAPGAAATAPMGALPMATAGSNAIAAGRTGTRQGDGVLLANPHFPWLGSARFYQVQLTIPGVLNVSGASLYGTPLVEIGHTEHLAWSHTVSTAQRFTLYQLSLTPGDPTRYVVDGRPEAMASEQISVPVRNADGSRSTVTRTLYSSRYGPMIASNWTATTALSIKGVNVDNIRSLNEWLAMDQSDSVAELRAAQDRYQGIPFVNTVAADSTGVAYAADATAVPHVTDQLAARCVDSPLAKSLYPNETVLDGSTSGCAWGSDPDAIEPGIFGPHTDPSLTRTDFTTNSNDSMWLTNPAQPLTTYPRIYGDVNTPRSLRTRMGLDQIQGRLQGHDGLGAPKFDLTSMQQLFYSDRDYSAEQARDAAVAMCRANPRLTAADGKQVDVSAACPVLAAWDLRGDPQSRGAALWRGFWFDAMSAPDVWSVPFDARNPADTPATLNTSSTAVRQALATAVERMTQLGTPLDSSLADTQVTTISGPPVPVPGCTGEEGCYNVAGSQPLANDGRFPPVAFGSTFVMAVELTPAGPRAATVLTYSESADPTSPHHGDQTLLYSRKQWVPDRYTPAQILSSPNLRVTVLAGS